MKVDGLDHLVLTVKDVESMCAFYTKVLGMEEVTFGKGRKALHFGNQKINLHQHEDRHPPIASNALPGSADLCFITQLPLSDVIAHLQSCRVEIILGPVEKVGARGPIQSIYFRDPDGNLVEVSNYKVKETEA